jgi:hypothetical protein
MIRLAAIATILAPKRAILGIKTAIFDDDT